MKKMGVIRTNIYLLETQKEKLEKLSARTGASLAWLVRTAIDKYLEERKKEIK